MKIRNNIHSLSIKGQNNSISELTKILEMQGFEIVPHIIDSDSTDQMDDPVVLSGKEFHYLAKRLLLQTELLSMIGHDLRSPLSSIKMILDFVSQNIIDPKSDEFMLTLPELNEAADEAFYLLENLLYYSRIKRQTIVYDPQKLNGLKIVQKVIHQLDRISKKKNITIEVDANPDITLMVDEYLIVITIRNLLANACKFSKENQTIQLQLILKDNKDCLLTIKDQGIGISEENKIKILDQGNLFHTYGTNQEKGNGMGINICQAIIEMWNGTFSISSKEGSGTTVSLTIPIAEV